ncbi:transposase [Streptomyces pratensis]|uniref:transposase n=1 Tax=Streptomyces pratensis TaxID=1169025 RepID=UPI0036311FBA
MRLAVSLTGGNRNGVAQLMPPLAEIPSTPGLVGRPRRRPDVQLRDHGYDHHGYRRPVRAQDIKPVIARRGGGAAHSSGLGSHRWVVERTIARLHGFRRLRIRRERHDDIHETFLDLATCLITHRHVQHLCRDFLRGGGNERCRADQGSPGLSLGAESTRFPLMGRLWWSSAVRGPGHRPVPGRGHDHGTGRCASPQPRIRAAQRLTSYARPQEATD